jgi:DNA-binding CsgD family transcriptional regulator
MKPRLAPGLESTADLRNQPKATPGAVQKASDQSTLRDPPVSDDHAAEQSHAAWHQLNFGEIDARLDVLSQQLLHNREDCFRRKVEEARNTLPTEVFQLNHRKILGDARRAADLDYLRRFFRGLCEVFEDSLTRLGGQLASQDLWDIWHNRIEPRWKRCVQILKAGLRRLYHHKPSQFVEALLVAFEDDAAHIHDRELALWRVKIEKAITRKRFVQGTAPAEASKSAQTAVGGKQTHGQESHAELPPKELHKSAERVNLDEKAIASAGRARKQYPKGFDALQEKYADMSGYTALVGLTPRQRECYSLRKEYNLPLAEVAARLGIHRKTAYEHINAAEKKIKLQLENRRDRSGRIKKAPMTD